MSTRRKALSEIVAAVVVSTAILSVLAAFSGFNTTGFAAGQPTLSYSKSLNISVNSTTEKTITLTGPMSFYLTSLRMSGSLSGEGKVQVYIDNGNGKLYLALDDQAIKAKAARNSPTGFVTSPPTEQASEKAQGPLFETPAKPTKPEPLSTTPAAEATPETPSQETPAVTQTPETTSPSTPVAAAGNSSTQPEPLSPTPTPNQTTSPAPEPIQNATSAPTPANTSTTQNVTATTQTNISNATSFAPSNITSDAAQNVSQPSNTTNVNVNVTNITNITQPTQNVTILPQEQSITNASNLTNATNTTNVTTPFEISFSEVCVDTCGLSAIDDFTKGSYRTVIEIVGNASLKLSGMSYTLVNTTAANETNATNKTLTVKIYDSKGREVQASAEILEKKSGKRASVSKIKDKFLASDLKEDLQDVRIIPISAPVNDISVSSVNVTNTSTVKIGLDSAPLEQNFVEVFAIDASNVGGNLSFTRIAKGSELYKCKDWDFAGQRCLGNWSKIQNLNLGQAYTITISPEDPGYGESGTLSAWLAYYTSTNPTLPKYRVWNGSMTAQANALNIGAGANAEWVVLKASPTRDEKILATLDDLGIVKAQIWNTSSQIWNNLQTIATGIGTTNDDRRGFDVAYENSSGRALVVASNGTATPVYNIWNGTGWQFSTSQTMPTDGCTGTVLWVVLKSKPSSNEILEVDQDSNGHICAQVWNGTTWVNNKTLDSANLANPATQRFDAAYETTSGDALVVWDKVSTPGILWVNTYSGAVWGASASTGLADLTGGPNTILWVKLASMPSSNRILVGVVDSEDDISAVEWSGTAFGTLASSIDPSVEPSQTYRTFDVAYIGATGNAMFVYTDNNRDVPSYFTCSGTGCASGTWTSGGTTTATSNFCGSAAANMAWVGLNADPFSNKIYLWGKAQTNFGKCFQEFDGTSWGTWNGNLGGGAILVNTEDVMASADRFRDTTPPQIQFVATTETSGTTLNRNYIQANVTASDAQTKLRNITIRLYNSSQVQINSTTTTTSPNTANFTGLSDGLYYFNATAFDVAGNSNSTETRNVTLDTQPPVVTVVAPSPGNNTFVASTSVTINASVVDSASNISVCTLNFDGANETMTMVGDGLSVTCNKAKSNLSQGLHNYTVFANDSAGNTGSNGTFFFTVDTVFPLVTFIAPTPLNGTTAGFLPITFKVNVTDATSNIDSCMLTLDGLNYSMPKDSNGTSITCTLTNSSMTGGVHTFNATANDSAGLSNTTETRTLTIKAAPTPAPSTAPGIPGPAPPAVPPIVPHIGNLTITPTLPAVIDPYAITTELNLRVENMFDVAQEDLSIEILTPKTLSTPTPLLSIGTLNPRESRNFTVELDSRLCSEGVAKEFVHEALSPAEIEIRLLKAGSIVAGQKISISPQQHDFIVAVDTADIRAPARSGNVRDVTFCLIVDNRRASDKLKLDMELGVYNARFVPLVLDLFSTPVVAAGDIFVTQKTYRLDAPPGIYLASAGLYQGGFFFLPGYSVAKTTLPITFK